MLNITKTRSLMVINMNDIRYLLQTQPEPLNTRRMSMCKNVCVYCDTRFESQLLLALMIRSFGVYVKYFLLCGKYVLYLIT